MTCNPFELTNLTAINDTSVSFDEFVVYDIKRVMSVGKLQIDKFRYELLVLAKVAVSGVITIMGNTTQNKSKDVSLTTQMITKVRAANITRENLVAMLFESEYVNTAQSIYNNSGTLYHGTKSDILKRFEQSTLFPTPSEYSAVVVDLSGIIKVKAGAACSTFNEFASVVYNHIIYLGDRFQSIDIIANRYFEDLGTNVVVNNHIRPHSINQ